MGTLADSTPSMMVKDYLVAGGRDAEFTGWTFKFGNMPDLPDQCITLVDSAGPASFPHLLVDYPRLQVLVRSAQGGNGYQTSWLMARKVYDIITGMDGHPPEFTELDGVTALTSSPILMGTDEKDRTLWSMNYQLLVEPVANALTNRVSL